MKIPKNYTEQEVLDIFNKVITKIAFKFKFGVNDMDDMCQQARLFAIEGLEKYNGKHPLENFLAIHVRNRLYNYKRDNYFRLSTPCERCPYKAFIKPDKCKKYEDRMDCELYRGWQERNTIRKNLTNSLEYTQVSVSEQSLGFSDSPVSKINTKEILDLIDRELPIHLRKFYLMQLSGNRLAKKDKMLLDEEIIKIIKNHGYEL